MKNTDFMAKRVCEDVLKSVYGLGSVRYQEYR